MHSSPDFFQNSKKKARKKLLCKKFTEIFNLFSSNTQWEEECVFTFVRFGNYFNLILYHNIKKK